MVVGLALGVNSSGFFLFILLKTLNLFGLNKNSAYLADMSCSGCREKTVPEKLSSIFDGWKHLIWKDKEVEKIAKDRAEICADCGLNRNGFCKQCECYLSAKIRSVEEKCPLDKWNKT